MLAGKNSNRHCGLAILIHNCLLLFRGQALTTLETGDSHNLGIIAIHSADFTLSCYLLTEVDGLNWGLCNEKW